MQTLTLRETARRYRCSPGYLSERVREGKPVKGHPLYKNAVIEDGRVREFRFEDAHKFPNNRKPLDPWTRDFAHDRLERLGHMDKATEWLKRNPPPDTWMGSVWEWAETEMPVGFLGRFFERLASW